MRQATKNPLEAVRFREREFTADLDLGKARRICCPSPRSQAVKDPVRLPAHPQYLRSQTYLFQDDSASACSTISA